MKVAFNRKHAPLTRLKQIDLLRALAVVLVLGRHMEPCPKEAGAFVSFLAKAWLNAGWIGVDIFFVLSGFLVSGLLFSEHRKHHRVQAGHFLIRRGFKIYPPFWLLIGVTILARLLQNDAPSLRYIATELLFLQNYRPGLWAHTWSLAVEEHFYFLLAFAFVFLARRRTTQPFKIIPAAFVILAFVCLGFRILTAGRYPFWLWTNVFPSHLRLDSLFFGALISYCHHFHQDKFVSFARGMRFPLLAAGLALLIPAFCLKLEESTFLVTFGFTMIYLGGGCLLVSALGFQEPASWFLKNISYVGSHSYSIYLWHLPAGAFCARLFGPQISAQNGWYVYAGVYLSGSIIFGMIMAALVEFPMLRLRDALFPTRGSSLVCAGPGHSTERPVENQSARR